MALSDEDVERELRRVAERIVSLGPGRLARPSERLDGATPEAAILHLGQQLSDLAADVEGRQRPLVPRLAPHALADQVIVLTRDALRAAEGSERHEALVDDVHQRLVALRRSL